MLVNGVFLIDVGLEESVVNITFVILVPKPSHCGGPEHLKIMSNSRVKFLEIGIYQVVFNHFSELITVILARNKVSFRHERTIVDLLNQLDCERRSHVVDI